MLSLYLLNILYTQFNEINSSKIRLVQVWPHCIVCYYCHIMGMQIDFAINTCVLSISSFVSSLHLLLALHFILLCEYLCLHSEVHFTILLSHPTMQCVQCMWFKISHFVSFFSNLVQFMIHPNLPHHINFSYLSIYLNTFYTNIQSKCSSLSVMAQRSSHLSTMSHYHKLIRSNFIKVCIRSTLFFDQSV